MNKTHSVYRVTATAGCLLLLVAVLLFWTTRLNAQRTISAAAKTRLQVPTVFPIGGLRIDLHAGTQSLAETTAGSRPHKTLLLFGADQCQLTASTIPKWRQLVQTLPSSGETVVAMASVGDRTPELIRPTAVQHGVTFAPMVVNDINTWVAGTGLGSTPMTVAIGEDGGIALVTSELNEDTFALFRDYFSTPTSHQLEHSRKPQEDQ